MVRFLWGGGVVAWFPVSLVSFRSVPRVDSTVFGFLFSVSFWAATKSWEVSWFLVRTCGIYSFGDFSQTIYRGGWRDFPGM